MTIREQISVSARPVPGQSTDVGPAAAAPAPSPVPVPLPDRSRDTAQPDPAPASESDSESESDSDTGDKTFPQPKLRLKIHDLDHPGAAKFLGAVNAATVLPTAVNNVLRLLYRTPSDQHTTCPPTRSVTLVLRDMDGVAYTTGSSLDNDHKEIHFSLRYINSIHPPSRHTHEITGVLTHELVHCYQWDARGTCPGGLIEGIADWVRLNCDLSPPHWKREIGGGWNKGYQHTAYFLDYLEQRFGEGTIRRLNEKLRRRKYKNEAFWTELLGQSVEKLYCDCREGEEGEGEGVKTDILVILHRI